MVYHFKRNNTHFHITIKSRRKMNRKVNLRKLALLSNKNWMYVHFKKIHLSQLYHKLNHSFLFHWQYVFVVPKEKEIKNIDGRSYTAETQTSDAHISIQVCVFFVDIGVLPALRKHEKLHIPSS